ncbi:hypothetical protein OIDMADRAFT_47241 [Oidiodendron maius Zn]|uniref:Nudix hydrolase domain-containing protein n=1 Tax=Oidiodendron maius (strain Zn) TaxID=913774 RepID=A0A0C3HWM4_OIDMZ|nr:hypothetical protein OIDMADRAFT_47241 [Oidiodendron maius Zn]
MPSRQSLHFSSQFVISCGTVTIDPTTKKVLLIFNRTSKQHLLPKGRKNTSETLESAAVRETFEETGIRCELLPHAFPHRAPLSPEAEKENGEAGEKPLGTEPIAVQQRNSIGVWKIIFWFIAKADSTIAKVEGTQEAYENYDTIWADANAAPRMMTRQGDKEIVTKAIETVLGVEKSEL